MKKIIALCLSLIIMVGVLPTAAQGEKTVKNVILMIPDGQSVGATTLARWYNGGEPLTVDSMDIALVRTYSADAAIADSAPAGTAYATGFKSHTGYIGVLPDVANMPKLTPIAKGQEKMPVANILEAAQLAGKSTGIVSTSEIMHATPAAFSSHYPNRKNYDALSEQQVHQEIDVVLGAGTSYLKKDGRADGEDMTDEIKKLGYDFITDRNALMNTTSDKVWGTFGDVAMGYDFDRDTKKEPALWEMTQKSIDILSKKSDNGFFLLVEGSKVDWASHANDPIGVISDTLAFDKAVKTAVDFAKQDGNTIVISVTDHGNGGITIGNKNTDSTYNKVHIDNYINPLKKATLTGEGIEKKLNAERTNIVEVMAQYYGITDLEANEIEQIKNTAVGKMNYTVGPMISKRANIGWTTTGHTGEDVPLYMYAPDGFEVGGVMENTDVSKLMQRFMGLNLAETTKTLFVPAREAFEAVGAVVSWDDTDAKNPKIVAAKGDTRIELPVDKNIAYVNGEYVKLPGVVVNNTICTYVPQAAIDLLK